jgi:O-antigen/teichoic acid export membrane protein
MKILARSLGPAGYGAFTIGMTVAGTVGMLVYGPIWQTATRFWSIAEHRCQIASYRAILVRWYLISLGLCAAGIVAATTLMQHWHLDGWIRLTQLCIAFAGVTGANTIASAVMTATRKRATLAAHQAAEALLRPAAIVLVSFFFRSSANTVAFAYCVIAMLVGMSLTTFAANTLKLVPVPQRVERQHTALTLEMLHYSGPFVLFALLGVFGVYGDKWLLKEWYTNEEVGKYAAMYQLASWPVIFLLGIVNQFVYPIIFSRVRDVGSSDTVARGHALYKLHIAGSLFIVATVALAAYAFGGFALRLLTSAEFATHQDVLWIIVIGVALFNLAQQLTLKGMYLNRPMIYWGPKATQSLSFFIMASLIGPAHGLNGVAVAYASSTAIYLALVWLANRRLLDESVGSESVLSYKQ